MAYIAKPTSSRNVLNIRMIMNSTNTVTTPIDASTLSIGIFDSGVGGLSVLRHIYDALPHEHLLYFADSGYAPYGDKPEADIIQRSLAITEFLLQQGIKALVIACNTATAIAIETIRQTYPNLPVVGVEPGLKPAAKLSHSKHIGVLATLGTTQSTRFHLLQQRMEETYQVSFIPQACVGLADQIEKGEIASPATYQLLVKYIQPLLDQDIDTLVLGCTHYPFVKPLIQQIIQQTNPSIAIIDTGKPVTDQLIHLLEQKQLLAATTESRSLNAFTTASESTLTNAFTRLLQLTPSVIAINT